MELPLIRSDRGAFLLEAVLAVAIVAVALSGLAISLSQCADASQMLGKEGRLRVALENRLSELMAGSVSASSNAFLSGDGSISIQQEIQNSPLRSGTKEALLGLYEVHLRASFVKESWPPLEITRVVYKP